MFRYLIVLLCLLTCCHTAPAQKENHVWTFGYNNGLDFTGAAPMFFQSATVSWEGSASVSDKDGNLLFYSNGNSVWGANHTIMPNGSGLLGNGSISPTLPGSSTQGVAIVQFVENKQRYYIFVLEAIDNIIYPPYLPGYLRYTVVDMSLNGGMGDVVPGQKNVVVDSGIAEQMCVTPGSGCNYWLIVHSFNSPVYKSFKIDATGIHPPVLSTGIHNNFLAGEMKVSPDGTKIAFTALSTPDTFSNPGVIELGSFNKATGVISGMITIDDQNLYDKYGLSFSPDNSKLYSSNYPSNLVQYDISSYPNVAAINSSKTVIANGGFAGMRIGPDEKIYIAPAWPAATAYIARINDPNQPGFTCNLDANALQIPAYATFPGSTERGIGLGNPVVILNGDVENVSSLEEVPLCPGDSVKLTADASYEDIKWDNGSTEAERTVKNAGIYWVKGKKQCGLLTDSFRVYLLDPAMEVAEGDTTLCIGRSVTLQAASGLESSYLWNTGSTAASITVSLPGTYQVTAVNSCGTFYDSVRIDFVECNCKPFIPNAFSPNKDGLNDLFKAEISCPLRHYTFSIYNRYGQRVYLSHNPEAGWNGTFNGKPVDSGTYFYYIQYTAAKGESAAMKGDVTLIR